MSADLHHLLLVFTVYIIGAASPGPSNMRIMGVAMQDGRRSALCLAAGVVSGSLFWGSLAATGISAVLAKYAQALVIMKILGGAYLLYLGFKAARSALQTDEQLANAAGIPQKASELQLYQRGLLMHLTNPKALLGWIATMSLGLGAEASQSTVAIILAGCAFLSVTIFCGYAIVFSTAPMIRAYQRARRFIEGSLAMVFGAAGLKLLLARF
ncbi:LysE family translocator [Pantoea sp. Ap-967]|uniref:LysE family translocator n=1 Tax=Pantoea sp. Ap-967 TaxID=2608362 RepID=UPI00141E38E7|nr:LysE family translocator [Pantoea sp. Ap-967]NIE77155.1 LysE family translocator [Pantoea sp. Ap-967]